MIIATAAGRPAIGLSASGAVTVTTLPPVFWASIRRIASWVTWRNPSRLVDTSDRKSSAV